MKQILTYIAAPFRWIRDLLIRGLLKLRALAQVQSLRDAIAEADRIHKETGKKVLVVYNKATKQWEAIEKQLLKAAHKKHKAYNRGRSTEPGIPLNRVKQIEKRSVYGT